MSPAVTFQRHQEAVPVLPTAKAKEREMIRLIGNMPPGTIGLEAVGKVTEDDYQNVLFPAVSAAI